MCVLKPGRAQICSLSKKRQAPKWKGKANLEVAKEIKYVGRLEVVCRLYGIRTVECSPEETPAIETHTFDLKGFFMLYPATGACYEIRVHGDGIRVEGQ